MNEIIFTLTKDESSSLVHLLAELPSRTGVYPLLVKMNQQLEDQLKTPEKTGA
jgi:hypothetical protein